jgi:AAA domain/Toprim domain
MTTGIAFSRIVTALEQRGHRVTGSGDRRQAQCPAHDDRKPSLAIKGIEGQALLYCFAGCITEDVLAALDLSMADLYDSRRGADYPYDDGRIVHRRPNKTFPQSGNKNGTPTLYRLSKVRQAMAAGLPVIVVEGEKDVHALESLGAVATTSPMGAGSAHLCDWSPLAGARVLIVADRDEPGEKHALQVLEILIGLGAQARVATPKTGKDAADHIAAGHGISDFILVEADVEAARQARHAQRVQAELDQLRVRDEAKRALAAEQRNKLAPPEMLTLRERLARPRPPKQWRISEWQPAGSRVMLVAQFKAGKTTMTGNLARCLVDGDLWLGRHNVTTVDGSVVILDFEMNADQIDDWLRDQRVRNDDKIVVVPMRGQAAAFDILDGKTRTEWADRLRACGASYLIVDCLRPILDAIGLDEHREAGRFLVAFDTLLAETGIGDAVIVHHMGHSDERSRGDSRIRDWPDVEWRLVRQDDDPASPRYVFAYGRDVDISETQLAYSRETRHLTLAGGSRKDVAARVALPDILVTLEEADGPLSGRQVEDRMAGSEHTQRAVRQALKLGVRLGSIVTEPGPKRSILHSKVPSVSVRQSASPVRQRTQTASAAQHPEGVPLCDAHGRSTSGSSAADDDTHPCDRCHTTPSQVDRAGTRLCASCAPHLFASGPANGTWSSGPATNGEINNSRFHEQTDSAPSTHSREAPS